MKAVWVDIRGGCDAAISIQSLDRNLWFTRMLTDLYPCLYRSNRERKCADTYWHSHSADSWAGLAISKAKI